MEDFSITAEDVDFTKIMKLVRLRRLIEKLQRDLERIRGNLDNAEDVKEEDLVTKLLDLQVKLAHLIEDPAVEEAATEIEVNSMQSGGMYFSLYPPVTTESCEVKREKLCKSLEELPLLPGLTGSSEDFEEKEEKVLNKLLRRGLKDQLISCDSAAKKEDAATDGDKEGDKVNHTCSFMGLLRKLYRLGAKVLRRTKN